MMCDFLSSYRLSVVFWRKWSHGDSNFKPVPMWKYWRNFFFYDLGDIWFQMIVLSVSFSLTFSGGPYLNKGRFEVASALLRFVLLWFYFVKFFKNQQITPTVQGLYMTWELLGRNCRYTRWHASKPDEKRQKSNNFVYRQWGASHP